MVDNIKSVSDTNNEFSIFLDNLFRNMAYADISAHFTAKVDSIREFYNLKQLNDQYISSEIELQDSVYNNIWRLLDYSESKLTEKVTSFDAQLEELTSEVVKGSSGDEFTQEEIVKITKIFFVPFIEKANGKSKAEKKVEILGKMLREIDAIKYIESQVGKDKCNRCPNKKLYTKLSAVDHIALAFTSLGISILCFVILYYLYKEIDNLSSNYIIGAALFILGIRLVPAIKKIFGK